MILIKNLLFDLFKLRKLLPASLFIVLVCHPVYSQTPKDISLDTTIDGVELKGNLLDIFNDTIIRYYEQGVYTTARNYLEALKKVAPVEMTIQAEEFIIASYTNEGQYDIALKHSNELLSQLHDPKTMQHLRQRMANCYLKKKMWHSALQILEVCRDHDALQDEPYNREWLEKRIMECQDAISILPGGKFTAMTLQPRYRDINIAVEKQDYNMAVQLSEKMIQANPEDKNLQLYCHWCMGVGYNYLKKFTDSNASYQFLVDLADGNDRDEQYFAAMAAYFIAGNYLSLGQVSQATTQYLLVIHKYPDSYPSAFALNMLIQLMEMMGQADQEESFLKEIIEKYPDLEIKFLALSRLASYHWRKMSTRDKAIPLLRQIISEIPLDKYPEWKHYSENAESDIQKMQQWLVK